MSAKINACLSLKDLVHMATIIRDLSPKQLEAWLTCGERIVAGMPIAEAEALMWSELELTAVPSGPDAVLVALCTNAQTADDRSSSLMDITDDMLPSDPRWSPAVDEARRIFDGCRSAMNLAATMPAKTAEGLRAKASLALRVMSETDFEDCPLGRSVLTQVAGEKKGWTFTPVPRFVPAGLLSDSRTGYVSPAFYDHESADAWIVIPPDGFGVDQRRFDKRSPNAAVRWAWDQANAPRPDPDLSGVAALAALMQVAVSSGIVSDIREQLCPCAPRPDAELISVCREYLGCDRIASDLREGGADPWKERAAFRAQSDRLGNAIREQNRLLPQIINLPAKTYEGVAMKARVIGALFAGKNGLRSAAVCSLTDDIAAVMGE